MLDSEPCLIILLVYDYVENASFEMVWYVGISWVIF